MDIAALILLLYFRLIVRLSCRRPRLHHYYTFIINIILYYIIFIYCCRRTKHNNEHVGDDGPRRARSRPSRI